MSQEGFILNGHHFDDKLFQFMAIDQLPVGEILSYHVFYKSSKTDKYFLLAKAGAIVDANFIERYQSKVKELALYSVVNSTAQNRFGKIFNKMKISFSEKELWKLKDEFLLTFADFYQDESVNHSRMDYYHACYKQFCDVPKEKQLLMYEQSEIMFQRSYRVAAITVMVAMIMGYVDYNVLRDIYLLSFLLDYGLFEDYFDYHFIQACEKERLDPGSGIKYLKSSRLPEKLIHLFVNHPIIGVKKIKEQFEGLFTHSELIQLVKYHHEQTGGEGFPNKINEFSLSDWEALVIFSDSIVSFEAVFYHFDDGYGFFEKILAERQNEVGLINVLPVKRVIARLRNLKVPIKKVS